MLDLQVHLSQCLLHVLHVLNGCHNQFAAVSQHRPHGANVLLGPKRRAK
jgi:hypothetical protein